MRKQIAMQWKIVFLLLLITPLIMGGKGNGCWGQKMHDSEDQLVGSSVDGGSGVIRDKRAYSPNPPDGTTGLSRSYQRTLTFLDPSDITNPDYQVYVGTTNPPPLIGTASTNILSISGFPLGGSPTTYYWRVDIVDCTSSAEVRVLKGKTKLHF